MAYAPHALLTFGGALGNNETWSVGLRLTAGGYSTASETDRYAWAREAVDPMVLPLQQFFSGNSGISSQARLNWVKLNPIGPDGRQVNDQTISDSNGGILLAQGSGSSTPFQLCLVASLRTGRLRGLASNGRIYWPAGVSAVDAAGQIGASAAKSLATYTMALVDGINSLTFPGQTMQPIVHVISPGRVGTAPGVSGPLFPVTAVRCGRVPDTQRRRRAKLVEDYQETTLADLA